MQDQIIASYTCFAGHVETSSQTLNVFFWPEKNYKHTCDTIYTHFQGITNNIYGFGRSFFLLRFFTCPPIFLPVYPYSFLPVQMMGGQVSAWSYGLKHASLANCYIVTNNKHEVGYLNLHNLFLEVERNSDYLMIFFCCVSIVTVVDIAGLYPNVDTSATFSWLFY